MLWVSGALRSQIGRTWSFNTVGAMDLPLSPMQYEGYEAHTSRFKASYKFHDAALST